VFPFETLCVTVLDTHHFRSPPEEGQKICTAFKYEFSTNRPSYDSCHKYEGSCHTYDLVMSHIQIDPPM